MRRRSVKVKSARVCVCLCLLRGCQLHTRSVSERNTEKDKALRSYFIFIFSGNLSKKTQTYRISGVHTFCRPDAVPRLLMHSFMCLPNILYFMCKHRLAPPPRHISRLRCRQKSMPNSSAVTFLLPSPSSRSTLQNIFHLHARNAAAELFQKKK